MKRYLPDLPFPAYSYVPGMHVHPISHPDGHSYQAETAAIETPADLRSCQQFLRGIDLFNGGFYWEAHEAWEPIWHAQKRAGAPADPIQGLIKLAAAGVKAREGSATGVSRHAARALQLLSSADASDLPINLDEVRALVQQVATRPERFLNTEAAPARILFTTAIQLSD
ncbi:DUF309 domain-containing protein [Blastopirellula sp. JC732]|uniref:DUF309 domain-containing protein n=1 Tax=Blastopirellula sediminis TaxID=2894196 RepID=A0A9X1SE40_9BACT|nr:DUF309 domain-containing protein [Blastopirellula sediminis]MCC9607852.1 DUF309 domain-containing protein [Blastopirellula sediminis]MCC9627355.1 DUF309 domain-containing protein [Blastopirellula sediminis]